MTDTTNDAESFPDRTPDTAEPRGGSPPAHNNDGRKEREMLMNDAPRTDAPRSRYSGGLRAADTDREATATRLRRSYSEGRLDQHEYEERIDRCYAAKHIGELAELTLDLPQPQDELHEREPAPQWPEMRHRAWRLVPIVPIVSIVLVLVLVSALTHRHLLWFPWPLLFFLFWGPFGRRWRANRER